jgi:hypothetical protein
MDINAALERMRQLVAAPHGTDSEADMAMVFEAIDGWLSKGGFKPSDWS